MTRSGTRAVAVALASILLSGCWWQQVGFDAGHTRFNPAETDLTTANGATLVEDWSVSLLGPPSEPIVRDGKVFTVAGDGTGPTSDVEAFAFDTTTGAPTWHTSLVSLPQQSSLFHTRPLTFVGDELITGYTALDLLNATGKVASLVRIDPATGAVLGSDSYMPPPTPVLDVEDKVVEVSALLSNPVQIWLAVRDGATFAVDWAWSVPLGGTGISAPVASDGQVFVVENSAVRAFPLACGTPCSPSWSYSLGQHGAVVAPAGSDDVFAVAGKELFAIDRATGQLSWQASLGATQVGVAVDEKAVYVSAGSGVLAFDVSGCGGGGICSPLWTGTLGTPASGSPAVAGGVVYVGSNDAVTAFPAGGCGSGIPTCAPIGGVHTSAPVRSLSVAGGQLYVASGNSLTSFAPS